MTRTEIVTPTLPMMTRGRKQCSVVLICFSSLAAMVDSVTDSRWCANETTPMDLGPSSRG